MVRGGLDRPPRDVGPTTLRTRSRVNEYGGGAFWVDGHHIDVVEEASQRVLRHRLVDGDLPADGTWTPRWVTAVAAGAASVAPCVRPGARQRVAGGGTRVAHRRRRGRLPRGPQRDRRGQLRRRCRAPAGGRDRPRWWGLRRCARRVAGRDRAGLVALGPPRHALGRRRALGGADPSRGWSTSARRRPPRRRRCARSGRTWTGPGGLGRASGVVPRRRAVVVRRRVRLVAPASLGDAGRAGPRGRRPGPCAGSRRPRGGRRAAVGRRRRSLRRGRRWTGRRRGVRRRHRFDRGHRPRRRLVDTAARSVVHLGRVAGRRRLDGRGGRRHRRPAELGVVHRSRHRGGTGPAASPTRARPRLGVPASVRHVPHRPHGQCRLPRTTDRSRTPWCTRPPAATTSLPRESCHRWWCGSTVGRRLPRGPSSPPACSSGRPAASPSRT